MVDNKRVMVVEDESIVSLDLQSVLEELGYEVTRVMSPAAEELRRALETPPDLVLMDINLSSEEDGIDMAGIIRTEYCIPVVYLTAYADEGTLQRASQTTPFGYLLKPFRTAQLRTTIEMALLMADMEAELHQAWEELGQQRVLALRSDRLRSLGEMAAGVAHELNQPLMGVRALAQHVQLGLERGWELSEALVGDKMRLIVEQADRMTHIIEHLRQFAREAGRPERRRISVNEIVTSGLGLVREQFRLHGLELVAELGQGLPLVGLDPTLVSSTAIWIT